MALPPSSRRVSVAETLSLGGSCGNKDWKARLWPDGRMGHVVNSEKGGTGGPAVSVWRGSLEIRSYNEDILWGLS